MNPPSCYASSGLTFYRARFTGVSPADTLATQYRLTTNADFNGKGVDVLVTMDAPPNNASGSRPEIVGGKFSVRQRNTNLVLNYQFVEAGTTTPLSTNWRARIGDLDNDERVIADIDQFVSLIANDPTNLTLSTSGAAVTVIGSSTNDAYLPEDTIEFALVNQSSFQVTYGPTNTTDHIYEFDLDLATALTTENCLNLAMGHISGAVYTDVNGNDGLDLLDTSLGSITVNLLNESDGSVVATTSSNNNGRYSFANLDIGLSYRIVVDTADTDLAGKTIGTANPLTGVTVTAGNTTADQDFGFDPASVQPPFTCDANIYIGSSASEVLPAQFYSVNTSTSPFTLNTLGSTAHGHSYNAMGYREQDDYLYAIKQSSSNLLRIGSDGSIVDLGAVTGLPVPSNIWQTYDSGDVFPDGYLYIHEVTTHPEIYKIDVTTTPPSLVETINLSQSIWLSDFAYNTIDNKVYGIGDQGEKFMIDPLPGQ